MVGSIGDRSLIGPYVSEYFRGETVLLGGYEILGSSLMRRDDLRTVFAVTGGLPAYVQYF